MYAELGLIQPPFVTGDTSSSEVPRGKSEGTRTNHGQGTTIGLGGYKFTHYSLTRGPGVRVKTRCRAEKPEGLHRFEERQKNKENGGAGQIKHRLHNSASPGSVCGFIAENNHLPVNLTIVLIYSTADSRIAGPVADVAAKD
ncbi:hypothetical protein F2P81_015289 [Scophthalmus maximus]|uniref:Uncharacterized protein n=1 Tax=Scophthalmus maximus TaxID=52904 RepID=A0A6A4SKA8_SCOMX|nr:hypothetical protein F2P81_015289 [Scophthalmus maximus]